jgi:hypothetical protein
VGCGAAAPAGAFLLPVLTKAKYGPRFFFSCVSPNADGFSGVLSRRFLEFANRFLFSQFPRHVPGKVILYRVRVFSV